jgi:two-component system nitrate/nitrite response regulator NarL
MADTQQETRSAGPHVLFVARARIHRDGFVDALRQHPHRAQGVTAASPDDVMDNSTLLTDADVVVVDVAEAEARETLSKIARAVDDDIPVIAVGVPPVEASVVACAEAGASGLLADDASVADIIETVTNAVAQRRNATVVAEILLRRVRVSAQELSGPRGQTLTRRELDVLELIADGLANKEIASALTLSVPTIKNHVQSILKKLGVRRRADAALWLRRQVAG